MPTPEELELMRQRLAADPAAGVSPSYKPPTFLERLSDSAERINANPVMQGIQTITNPIGTAIQSAFTPAPRDITSFTRETPPDPAATVREPTSFTRETPPTAPAAPKPAGGGGGLFSNGLGVLKGAWEKARATQLGNYETDKSLAGEQGINQVAKVLAMSDLQEQQAAQIQAAAEKQAQVDAEANERHAQFMNRSMELADDVAKQQVDPGRFFQSKGAGEKALYIVGGVLGGMLQGLQGSGENSFIRQVNHLVDSDIAAQQSAIDNKKASLGARGSLLNQMMQETGDRRLAAMQTRNLMFESMKQSLAAKADALGVPEIRTRAQQGIQALQREQDNLNEVFKREAYGTAVSQANAAAAARAHAEQVAWDRAMKVNELGLKKDELEIQRLKAGKELGDDERKQLQDLSKQLADPKLVANRKLINDLESRIFNADGSAKIDADGKRVGLPGVGAVGDLRDKLRPTKEDAFNPFVGFKAAANSVAGLSPEERVTRQDYDRVALAYQNAVTGSGGSEAEAQRIAKAFKGANTPEEQANAIALAKDSLKQVEARTYAGYDPKVVRTFRARLNGEAPDMPGTVEVKK